MVAVFDGEGDHDDDMMMVMMIRIAVTFEVVCDSDYATAS